MLYFRPFQAAPNTTATTNAGDSARLTFKGGPAFLLEAGYRSVPQVNDHGDFAFRGSLIDVFPMGEDAPFRIDLLGDEIADKDERKAFVRKVLGNKP